MLLTSAHIASIKVPTIRKGIDNNHRKGQKSNITIAIGQQRANRIPQRIKVNNVFIIYLINL